MRRKELLKHLRTGSRKTKWEEVRGQWRRKSRSAFLGSVRFVACVCDEIAESGQEKPRLHLSARQTCARTPSMMRGCVRAVRRVSGCGGVVGAAEVLRNPFKCICINPRWSGLASSGIGLSRTLMSSRLSGQLQAARDDCRRFRKTNSNLLKVSKLFHARVWPWVTRFTTLFSFSWR